MSALSGSFEALNSAAAEKDGLYLEAKALSPDTAQVQRTLSQPTEGPGPDSVPGQTLRECVDRLANVLMELTGPSHSPIML